MILIIGGSYQGKTEYAKEFLHGPEEVGNYADGSADDFDKIMTCPLILGFHHYIRRILNQADTDAELAVEQLIQRMLSVNPDVVITMDEVGYGIVPMTREDRDYREAVGRAGQLLAERAVGVHRVLCGVGMQIK